MSSFRLPVMKKAAVESPATRVRNGRFGNIAPTTGHGQASLRRGFVDEDKDKDEGEGEDETQQRAPMHHPEMSECAVCLEPYAISEGQLGLEDEHAMESTPSRPRQGMQVEDDALCGGGGGGAALKLPYLLHCGHSFCAECLEHCAETERSKSRRGFFSSSSSSSASTASSAPSGRSRLFGSLLPAAFTSSASPTSPSSPPRLKVSVTCPVCRYRTPYDSARGPVGGLPKNYELITAIRVIRSLVTAAASSPPRQQQQQQRDKRKRKRTARRQNNDCGEKEEKRIKQKKNKNKKARSSASPTKSVDITAWKTLVITSTDQPAQTALGATTMTVERSSVPVGNAVGAGVECEEDVALPTAPPAHLFGDDAIHMQDEDGDSGGRAETRQSFGPTTATSPSSAALSSLEPALPDGDDPTSPPPSAPPLPFPFHIFHYTSSSPSFASSSSASSSPSTTPALFSPSAPPAWAFPAFLSLPTPARTSAAGAINSDASDPNQRTESAPSASGDAQAASTGQWVDSSASCMRCQVAFGLFTRHRRCHYCGGIFCYRCCWQFCEMPVSFGYKRKQRTCIGCAPHLKSTQLTQLRSPSPPPTDVSSGQAGSPFASSLSSSSSSSSLTAVVDEIQPSDSAPPLVEEEHAEEWPSFDLKDKLAAVYDISCKAVDVGVEAVALAKGEASVEESVFVPSESTMLWGRCMGVMVALPLFVLGTSSLLMAAGGYHAWSFLARQRRKWHQEKQIEEEEARITEARLRRRRQPPQLSRPGVDEEGEDQPSPAAPLHD